MINQSNLKQNSAIRPTHNHKITAIYETIYSKNQKLFNFNAHIKRLNKGAKYLKIQFPKNKNQIFSEIKNLLKNKQNNESRIKIILQNNKLTYQISPILKINSNKLITFQGSRPIPQIKNLNRLIEDKAYKTAQQNKCIDAILVNNKNNITEGSISNFFGIINNQIYTAKNQILCGTTRSIIIKIAKKNKIKIQYKQIPITKIPELEGAFITNAIKKIIPIYQIDSYKIPKNQITELLIQEFPKDLFE